MNNIKLTLNQIKSVPFIGLLFTITNAYVHHGSPEHIKNIAPFNKWYQRLGKGIFSSIILSILLLSTGYLVDVDIKEFKPEEILLSLFPNLLGFGIGVFALLFSLPNEFFNSLLSASLKSKNDALSPQMLPVDMAYPLVVYCFAIIITTGCAIFPDSWLSTGIILVMLFYGLFVTLSLISSIFNTASYMITIRKIRYIQDNEPKDDSENIPS